MKYFVNLDSLYITVRYPRKDVFEKWYREVKDVDRRALKRGVPASRFVIRTGMSGYKVSVCSHGIRANLTDDVDEKRGEGQGMGIWVQIGPKYIVDHPLDIELKTATKEFLIDIGVKKDWPISVTRIDLAIDLIGESINDQSVEQFRKGWVGRSKVSSSYFNSRSGELETVNVGSRRSAVYLRIYDKVAQAKADGDLEYWLDVWEGYTGPVTRVEWEVKPNKGGFKDLEDFEQLCEWRLVELLNYLIDWGRLCIPNPGDSNNRRWKSSPLWQKVKDAAEGWRDEITWPTSRKGKEFKGITDSYIRSVTGNISGAMARLSPENPNFIGMLTKLDEHDFGMKKIQKIAEEKAEIFSRS